MATRKGERGGFHTSMAFTHHTYKHLLDECSSAFTESLPPKTIYIKNNLHLEKGYRNSTNKYIIVKDQQYSDFFMYRFLVGQNYSTKAKLVLFLH